MEIKAKSKYDFEAVKALTHAISYKKKNPRKVFCFWNIFAVVFMLIFLIMLSFTDDRELFFYLGLTLLIIVLECFIYWGLPKIQYKTLAKMQGVENEYTFCEDIMKVTSKNDEYYGETELKYSLIPKVIETSKYLFVYQSKNQVYIVDKRSMIDQDVKEIRTKLMSLVGKKYLLCKY